VIGFPGTSTGVPGSDKQLNTDGSICPVIRLCRDRTHTSRDSMTDWMPITLKTGCPFSMRIHNKMTVPDGGTVEQTHVCYVLVIQKQKV
jgi:hypothetical protein